MTVWQMLEFWTIGWSMLLLGRVAYAHYLAYLARKQAKRLVKTLDDFRAALATLPNKRSAPSAKELLQ
jgi:hypothetical protein